MKCKIHNTKLGTGVIDSKVCGECYRERSRDMDRVFNDFQNKSEGYSDVDVGGYDEYKQEGKEI